MPKKRQLVLVIEDDRAARKVYAEMLAEAGLDVSEAHNGFQAAEKAYELLPDVIVTDLGLPGIDGYELCRRLQQDPRTLRTPIVAMTGRYFSNADVARARREGCHSVLIKPFVSEDLVVAVRRALESAGGIAGRALL